MTLNKWAVLLIGVLFFTGGHPHSSVDSEAVSVTSYICTSAMQVRMALATEKKNYARMVGCHLPSHCGFTEYFPAELPRTSLAFFHLKTAPTVSSMEVRHNGSVLQIIFFPISIVLVKFKANQYWTKLEFWNQYPLCWRPDSDIRLFSANRTHRSVLRFYNWCVIWLQHGSGHHP